MKKYLLFFAVCLILAAPAFSQTAAELERLLEANPVTYEQAAWFVLRAADVYAASPEGAFNHAAEQNWLPANAAANDGVVLGGLSLLFMQAFDLKGGLFYSFAKTPHYAYRELVYRDIIQGRADPDMAVSGDYLLFLLGRVLSGMEND